MTIKIAVIGSADFIRTISSIAPKSEKLRLSHMYMIGQKKPPSWSNK